MEMNLVLKYWSAISKHICKKNSVSNPLFGFLFSEGLCVKLSHEGAILLTFFQN